SSFLLPSPKVGRGVGGEGVPPSLILFKEQRVHKSLMLELREVGHLFAGADVGDGDAELARDGEGDAAFGGAVQLGDGDVGDVDRFGELARLHEPVLAGGSV